MSTLIIDIETVGERWDELDSVTQEVLSRWLRQSASDTTEYDVKLAELKAGLGFSPLTGYIAALGVYDLERKQGTVYYQTDTSQEDERVGAFTYRPRNEAAMLAEFWDGVQQYEIVVTFNGRMFDVPFLLHRSIANSVVPTVDLMRYRYLTQQVVPYHIDLADQLTFYGAMSKRPSLHLFCRTYGIESPKSHGVAGDDVATLYAAKRFRDIAVYNSHDLLATALLYDKWRTYLAPGQFRKQAEPIDF
jgi:3'-5' exonuclease